jgi:hypothetical protein
MCVRDASVSRNVNSTFWNVDFFSSRPEGHSVWVTDMFMDAITEAGQYLQFKIVFFLMKQQYVS